MIEQNETIHDLLTQDASPHTDQRVEVPIKSKKKRTPCIVYGAIGCFALSIIFICIACIALFFGGQAIAGLFTKSILNFQNNSFGFTVPGTGDSFQFGKNTQIPSTFPPIPQYPNSTIVTVFNSKTNPSIVFSTKDAQDKIIPWIEKEFAKIGWTVLFNGVNYSIDNKQFSGSIVIVTQNESSLITIVLSKKSGL
ncbi:MAG: hypothetical protein WCO06_05880 [Candidatus Roizmanbacteria bacterium]